MHADAKGYRNNNYEALDLRQLFGSSSEPSSQSALPSQSLVTLMHFSPSHLSSPLGHFAVEG